MGYSGGWFSRKAKDERVGWMNGVRYVKYVCRIFRGLLERRVSLAETPETASRGGGKVECRWESGGRGRGGGEGEGVDGFGYASPRPGWICRRHLPLGNEKLDGKEGIPLVTPLGTTLVETETQCKFFSLCPLLSRDSEYRSGKRQLHYSL